MEPDTARVIAHCEANLRVCGNEVTDAITQLILTVNRLGKVGDDDRTVFTQDTVSSLRGVLCTLINKRRESEEEIKRQSQFARIDTLRRQYQDRINDLTLQSARINEELKKAEARMEGLNKLEQEVRRRPAPKAERETKRRAYPEDSFSLDLNDEN